MNKIFNFSLFLLLTLSFSTGVLAQTYTPSTERSDPKKRAKGQMEGNKIRTTIFNTTQTGREGGSFPISVQTPYEWPKNTGKVYLAMTGLFAGGEVVDQNNVTQKIVDVFNYRQSPSGKTWNIEPMPGYYNNTRQEIATSVDQGTWPDFWPDKLNDPIDAGWKGSWNGYFGKNIFNADQEMFYRAGDDRYDRYQYFPDESDHTRYGLGVVYDVRTLAWSQVLVEDVIYLLHNLKNDGDKNINKFAVTIWYADFVGGVNDSQDDWSEFDLIEDIAWSRDRDNVASSFGNDPVGIIAVTFLETPGNATDRIDNDGDGELNGPKISGPDNVGMINMLAGEKPDNLIDDNGNGLIDENTTHVPFGLQLGVTYADYIDQNGDGEANSPVITQEMVDFVQSDLWKRWPKNVDTDPVQAGKIHLLMLETDDIGMAFRDFIDNNSNGELNSPVVTQAMIDAAASDAPYFRYKVPGTSIILYDVKAEDLGKMYADGIDNDGNKAIDEYIDERIDEMVDEARDNGIDDDGDWNVLTDDVGLDGVPGTGDPGENDGKPTTGAGLGLPGEPSIDVTDVSETDQIGITNAQYIPAGNLNVGTATDIVLWFDFMIPGKFYNPLLGQFGEYDLMVSSGFFPLKSGQTEPISLAVILANGPVSDPNGAFRKAEILKKRNRAQETYNNDYQFANAPVTPTLTAIPGDNKVTLYWDDAAEQSFDAYINNIGGIGKDFEGYRIYRASDPAFEDAELITTGYGVSKFKLPIKQFDLKDGWVGFDSTGIEGVHFYLGDDTGLSHSWVDSSAKNGFTYYYAITSYDFGFPAGNILPSESPIRISIQSDGTAKLGPNVKKVTPESPSAGYVPPTLGNIELLQGSTTGKVSYEIVDINAIRDGHVYYLTFEDTLKKGNVLQQKPDTLTTKNFTLFDSTANLTLLSKSTLINSDDELPLTDGFRLLFNNELRVEIDRIRSKWNNTTNLTGFEFSKVVEQSGKSGTERTNDYEIQFGPLGTDTSQTIEYEVVLGTSTPIVWPGKPVNFKVWNKSEKKYIDFGFVEVEKTGGEGLLTANITKGQKDRIIFLEKNPQDSLIVTWWFFLNQDTTGGLRFPSVGDTAVVYLKKPFLSSDKFRFVAAAGKINTENAKKQLDDIKVVPNPYVASAVWEPKNPYVSGRGPRSLHFTHLPAKCTIRIFTVNGELVETIEHDSPFSDGTAYWDMLSKDNLSISYGVYIFHVDAPGIGEKIGKFAVIK